MFNYKICNGVPSNLSLDWQLLENWGKQKKNHRNGVLSKYYHEEYKETYSLHYLVEKIYSKTCYDTIE